MITIVRHNREGSRRFEWNMIDAGVRGVKISVYREFEKRGGEWRETKSVGGDFWPEPPLPHDVLREAKRRLKDPAR
jgi:hypothetical protein